MTMLNVDDQGFDSQDRRLLMTIIEKFGGGPVGVDNLAAAIGEERDTIEETALMSRSSRALSCARRAGGSRHVMHGCIAV